MERQMSDVVFGEIREMVSDEERRRVRDAMSEEERQKRFQERSNHTMLQILSGMSGTSIESRFEQIEKRLEALELK